MRWSRKMVSGKIQRTRRTRKRFTFCWVYHKNIVVYAMPTKSMVHIEEQCNTASYPLLHPRFSVHSQNSFYSKFTGRAHLVHFVGIRHGVTFWKYLIIFNPLTINYYEDLDPAKNVRRPPWRIVYGRPQHLSSALTPEFRSQKFTRLSKSENFDVDPVILWSYCTCQPSHFRWWVASESSMLAGNSGSFRFSGKSVVVYIRY